MADNVDVTPGAGKTVASDDIQVDGSHGQGQVQFVKLVDGTLNGTGSIRVNQAAKANALTIAPASDITDTTYIGNVKVTSGVLTETNSGSIKTAVELIDNAIAGTEMQVDVVAALPAGTNLIGKVGIDQTTPGTTNRVDIGALIPGVGVTNLGKAEDAAHSSGDVGVMALTVRKDAAAALGTTDVDYQPLITDANGRLHVLDANTANMLTALQIMDDWDDTDKCKVIIQTGANAIGTLAANSGVDIGDVTINNAGGAAAVNIQDGGNTITVDGTLSTVSAVTNLAQMGGVAIALNEGALGTGVQRVTLATDDDAVAHLATIAGDTTNIETAVEKIDDWDATHDDAASADGPQLMGAYDSTKPTAIGDGDAVRLLADAYGRLLAGVEPERFQATFTSADAQAATPVKAKTADKKMYILSLVVSTDTAMNIQFQDDAATVILIEQLYLAANGGAHLTWPPEAPLVVNTNKDFDVIASAAGNISVTITGYLAP